MGLETMNATLDWSNYLTCEQPVAVFDFDGTLVSHDSATAFIKDLILQSWPKTLAALLATPFALPLFLSNGTRRFGISVYCWIATLGYSARDLLRAARRFQGDYFDRHGANVYQEAVDKIREHQKLGHEILVLSGSMPWMIRLLLRYHRIKVNRIIGTRGRRFLGGFIIKVHCYHKDKLRMARRLGLDIQRWRYGYSDSAADIPLLEACQKRFLINPSKRTIRRYRRRFGKSPSVLRWRPLKRRQSVVNHPA